jgi:hypothetical protein
MKTDIRKHCDEDLSMFFLNEEPLYEVLRNSDSFEEVKGIADLYFLYTKEQLNDLHKTYMLEKEEF